MKKNPPGAAYAPAPSVVDVQLQNLEAALGPAWRERLGGVADETIRTWRKRGAVASQKLMRASELSERPLSWFNMNQPAAGEPPRRFFLGEQEKQVTQSERIDSQLLAHLLALVDAELADLKLTLPDDKRAELVALLYERFAGTESTQAAQQSTVRRHLRLIS